MEEFMLSVPWSWVAATAWIVFLAMVIPEKIASAWHRVKMRIRGAPPPFRRRAFKALAVPPDQADEFCRNNPEVFTPEAALRLLDLDEKPNYPDVAAFGEVLARAKTKYPGMQCLFYITGVLT